MAKLHKLSNDSSCVNGEEQNGLEFMNEILFGIFLQI